MKTALVTLSLISLLLCGCTTATYFPEEARNKPSSDLATFYGLGSMPEGELMVDGHRIHSTMADRFAFSWQLKLTPGYHSIEMDGQFMEVLKRTFVSGPGSRYTTVTSYRTVYYNQIFNYDFKANCSYRLGGPPREHTTWLREKSGAGEWREVVAFQIIPTR